MLRLSLIVFCVSSAVLCASSVSQERNNQNPAPVAGWESDLAAGFAEAKKSGKPLMIVFRCVP